MKRVLSASNEEEESASSTFPQAPQAENSKTECYKKLVRFVLCVSIHAKEEIPCNLQFLQHDM